MKYGDIVLQSIRKMFLNNDNIEIDDLDIMKTDKIYKVYMDGIHITVNNAINILLNKCIPYIVSVSVTPDYDLSSLTNFKYVVSVVDSNGDKVPYKVENNTLKIEKNATMLYSSRYVVEETTAWTEELPIPYEDCILIPLYVAGELYKDDDLTLATMYLNEFEQEIERNKYQTAEIEQVEDLYGAF